MIEVWFDTRDWASGAEGHTQYYPLRRELVDNFSTSSSRLPFGVTT